jgi:4-aminobutyrate aminotransferase
MKETGALAVNSAIKACLKINPSRRHFIAFDGAFHGRVEFSRALSRSKSIHQKDYPETGIHVHHFPYPQITQDINFINESLNRIPVENINAVITEVIQGEGGMQFANPHLLKDLLLNFQNKDILAGIDDIQAGNGRTGFWSSWEWLNYMTPNSPEFVPDFVIQGKALGGGLPIGAVIFPKNDLPNGWEGGTFPWFPASVAQAIIFLDIVEEEKLVEKVRENGEYLADKLKSVNEYVLEMVGEAVPRPYNLIQKGIGFMQGLEFRKEWREPDARLRNKVLANLAENGVLTQGAGNDNINPTIRFTPPYITTNKDIDEMAEALKKSIIQALN